jgi:hypothetical protein
MVPGYVQGRSRAGAGSKRRKLPSRLLQILILPGVFCWRQGRRQCKLEIH